MSVHACLLSAGTGVELDGCDAKRQAIAATWSFPLSVGPSEAQCASRCQGWGPALPWHGRPRPRYSPAALPLRCDVAPRTHRAGAAGVRCNGGRLVSGGQRGGLPFLRLFPGEVRLSGRWGPHNLGMGRSGNGGGASAAAACCRGPVVGGLASRGGGPGGRRGGGHPLPAVFS
jgi:hypothetical protein